MSCIFRLIVVSKLHLHTNEHMCTILIWNFVVVVSSQTKRRTFWAEWCVCHHKCISSYWTFVLWILPQRPSSWSLLWCCKFTSSQTSLDSIYLIIWLSGCSKSALYLKYPRIRSLTLVQGYDTWTENFS